MTQGTTALAWETWRRSLLEERRCLRAVRQAQGQRGQLRRQARGQRGQLRRQARGQRGRPRRPVAAAPSRRRLRSTASPKTTLPRRATPMRRSRRERICLRAELPTEHARCWTYLLGTAFTRKMRSQRTQPRPGPLRCPVQPGLNLCRRLRVCEHADLGCNLSRLLHLPLPRARPTAVPCVTFVDRGADHERGTSLLGSCWLCSKGRMENQCNRFIRMQ